MSISLIILTGLLIRQVPAENQPAQALGTIVGKVFGGSDIVIPNAQVSIADVNTQSATTITTAYDGSFAFPRLAPGRYLVSVTSMAGFTPITVDVNADATAKADMRIERLEILPQFAKARPLRMAELRDAQTPGVSAVEVSDYVFGNYQGDFLSPPHADGNARKAVIIFWKDFPFRFVFSHEGSYCPWFEFPSGSALCYQFFEGNEGWAELFNNWGRKENNSFVDILEPGPNRVWIRWTYFGVNLKAGEPAYRAVEDFWAYPNGLILRRQTYQTLRPGDYRGYAREPIEMIGLCPVGRTWRDVLAREPGSGESHALAVLDLFSSRRYDVFWQPKPDTVWQATARRTGATWRELDDAVGVALVIPMQAGSPFCIFGDASGFRRDFTRIKEHSHTDTGGVGWISQSWDHWPIGWLNSQGHEVDAQTLNIYPNHFSPVGMDFFALPNEETERGEYYSLLGIGMEHLETIRALGRQWLEFGSNQIPDPHSPTQLPAVFNRAFYRNR